MTDWSYMALRWATYGDLGLLFGLASFSLCVLRGEERERFFRLPPILAVLAVVGLLLSLAGFVMLSASMTGVDPAELDFALLRTLVLQTIAGWAFLARCAALTGTLAACLIPRRSLLLPLTLVFGAMAVASLAFAGHGASTTGVLGYVHLAGDIVHLLAASMWLGAIAVLLALMTGKRSASANQLRVAHRALEAFAPIGTAIVALIILTGIVNMLFIVGPSDFSGLTASRYGQLLFAKIALFAMMLGLAATNRFRLTPALGQARLAAAGQVLRRLRLSLTIEFALAVSILGLVAWLGRLEP